MRRADMDLPHLGESSNHAMGWVIWMRYWNSKNEESNTHAWTDYVAVDTWNHWTGSYMVPLMFKTKKDAVKWLKLERKRLESDPSRFNYCRSWWPDTFKYDIRLCRYQLRVVVMTDEDRRLFGGRYAKGGVR